MHKSAQRDPEVFKRYKVGFFTVFFHIDIIFWLALIDLIDGLKHGFNLTGDFKDDFLRQLLTEAHLTYLLDLPTGLALSASNLLVI